MPHSGRSVLYNIEDIYCTTTTRIYNVSSNEHFWTVTWIQWLKYMNWQVQKHWTLTGYKGIYYCPFVIMALMIIKKVSLIAYPYCKVKGSLLVVWYSIQVYLWIWFLQRQDICQTTLYYWLCSWGILSSKQVVAILWLLQYMCRWIFGNWYLWIYTVQHCCLKTWVLGFTVSKEQVRFLETLAEFCYTNHMGEVFQDPLFKIPLPISDLIACDVFIPITVLVFTDILTQERYNIMVQEGENENVDIAISGPNFLVNLYWLVGLQAILWITRC